MPERDDDERPVTLVELTTRGRAAFEEYTKALHRLLEVPGDGRV
ncbi:hypothetical protein H074_31312 [Amycolatopsis decaplanina DSM 44594]|uniref:Uncharacterized protein n=1 Tax=Amycolatopsis decaplanina DSM 44594 TaxID=1284240 RepID=M2WVY9_9PSEU|nr:hypothetical protein H074_31312 [Amycolatopsis decaplanina DSM 44594]